MNRYRRDGQRLRVFNAALERLRARCLSLPFTSEASSWGNPTWMFNGKAIAVLDQYKGADCLWVRCETDRRSGLLGKNGYFTTPYDKNEVGICRTLDGLDEVEMTDLVERSYESLIV